LNEDLSIAILEFVISVLLCLGATFITSYQALTQCIFIHRKLDRLYFVLSY
jgi:hypothetical protein